MAKKSVDGEERNSPKQAFFPDIFEFLGHNRSLFSAGGINTYSSEIELTSPNPNQNSWWKLGHWAYTDKSYYLKFVTSDPADFSTNRIRIIDLLIVHKDGQISD